MAQYVVRSGQNIYDVALTLYGSVEGIFDLLVNNPDLNMETQLSYGMVLEYSEQFVLNQDIVIWLQNNKTLVKNGEYVCNHPDIETLIKDHVKKYHDKLYSSLLEMSADEQSMYWEGLYMPKMVIRQQGQVTAMVFTLKDDKHFIVDWGDSSAPQIIEGTEEQEIEHCYKGNGNHTITLYGDFEFDSLDFSNLNGIYYPLNTIYADRFISNLNIKDIDKLIITQ